MIAELDGILSPLSQIIDPTHEESHYLGDIPGDLRAIDIWIGEEIALGKVKGRE